MLWSLTDGDYGRRGLYGQGYRPGVKVGPFTWVKKKNIYIRTRVPTLYGRLAAFKFSANEIDKVTLRRLFVMRYARAAKSFIFHFFFLPR